jgi:hypothetical protein
VFAPLIVSVSTLAMTESGQDFACLCMHSVQCRSSVAPSKGRHTVMKSNFAPVIRPQPAAAMWFAREWFRHRDHRRVLRLFFPDTGAHIG